MKHIFTFLLTLLICNVKGQSYPYLNLKGFYAEFPQRSDLFDSAVAANHYHTVKKTLTQFNDKGSAKKRSDTTVLKYDDNGYLLSISESNSKNKRTEKREYMYKDSLVVDYKYFKNEKLQAHYTIDRNTKKKITDLIKMNGKGEVVSKQHNDYDEAINRLSRMTLSDKTGKEKSAIEYTYYDQKSMKQAKEFKNGKLKKVWNYTCDPVGTEDKKVKEVKVCKNVNVDENGNRVETNRIVNPNGDIELRVNTFDKKDNMIKQLVYNDVTHELRSEYLINYKTDGQEVIYKVYDKKQKPLFITITNYNNFHKMLSNEYRVGKKLDRVFKNTFLYNDKNLMTHSESFNSKGKKASENIHTYK